MRSPIFMKAMDADDAGESDLALRLMETCATQDDPVACFTMALWYRDGAHGPINLELSERWLAQLLHLAEGDNAEAKWEVGQNYRFANLFPENIERANYWLERAAEAGHADAQHHFAFMYALIFSSFYGAA